MGCAAVKSAKYRTKACAGEVQRFQPTADPLVPGSTGLRNAATCKLTGGCKASQPQVLAPSVEQTVGRTAVEGCPGPRVPDVLPTPTKKNSSSIALPGPPGIPGSGPPPPLPPIPAGLGGSAALKKGAEIDSRSREPWGKDLGDQVVSPAQSSDGPLGAPLLPQELLDEDDANTIAESTRSAAGVLGAGGQKKAVAARHQRAPRQSWRVAGAVLDQKTVAASAGLEKPSAVERDKVEASRPTTAGGSDAWPPDDVTLQTESQSNASPSLSSSHCGEEEKKWPSEQKAASVQEKAKPCSCCSWAGPDAREKGRRAPQNPLPPPPPAQIVNGQPKPLVCSTIIHGAINGSTSKTAAQFSELSRAFTYMEDAS